MQHRMLVLGAGAAGRLARRLHPEDTEIALVNAEPEFIERVRMHQLAVGQSLLRRALADLFADTGYGCGSRVADLGRDGLACDTLVCGIGGAAARRAGVPNTLSVSPPGLRCRAWGAGRAERES